MTEEKENYNFRGKSGPAQGSSPALYVIQVKTKSDDNELIRSLVGTGQLSGFGWRACMVMLGVLYSDAAAQERTRQIWIEILHSSTVEQLEQIKKGLAALMVMIEQVAIERE